MENNKTQPLLPDARILRKLQSVDPDAGEWVFARSTVIGEERRKLEKSMSSSLKQSATSVFSVFMRTGNSDVAELNQRNPWEMVGNNLRRAIQDYCTCFPEKAAAAALTKDDLAALEVTRDRKTYDRICLPA